jgi:hypothetical protein
MTGILNALFDFSDQRVEPIYGHPDLHFATGDLDYALPV